MIDLQRFCGQPDEPREQLCKPFRIGAWVYATNRHICVRVPSEGSDAPESPRDGINPEKLFVKWKPTGDLFKLPKLENAKKCARCNGIGHLMAEKCVSCDGTGEFDRDGYIYDCKACDEDESVPPGFIAATAGSILKSCELCCGIGSWKGDQLVGGVNFELAYLQWIEKLPNVIVFTATQDDAMFFAFDGGEGLLMPKRPMSV